MMVEAVITLGPKYSNALRPCCPVFVRSATLSMRNNPLNGRTVPKKILKFTAVVNCLLAVPDVAGLFVLSLLSIIQRNPGRDLLYCSGRYGLPMLIYHHGIRTVYVLAPTHGDTAGDCSLALMASFCRAIMSVDELDLFHIPGGNEAYGPLIRSTAGTNRLA